MPTCGSSFLSAKGRRTACNATVVPYTHAELVTFTQSWWCPVAGRRTSSSSSSSGCCSSSSSTSDGTCKAAVLIRPHLSAPIAQQQQRTSRSAAVCTLSVCINRLILTPEPVRSLRVCTSWQHMSCTQQVHAAVHAAAAPQAQPDGPAGPPDAEELDIQRARGVVRGSRCVYGVGGL